MKEKTKKLLIVGLLAITLVIGFIYVKNRNKSNKNTIDSKTEINKESGTAKEDYNSMDIIELKSKIDSKEEELRKTNDEIAKLNEEYSNLSEKLRELSQEELEKIERQIGENNKTPDKSSSEIVIEDSDSDEIKIQKIKEKMQALHFEVEKQNKYTEEQIIDLNNAYEAYAKLNIAK